MDLADFLHALRSARANLEAQITLAQALGGMTLTQTADLAGSTVATVADVLQRVIDGAITASEADEAELRAIYDAVLDDRNAFDEWAAGLNAGQSAEIAEPAG
ncbi:MAG: hypothetical protein ACK4Z7_09665 [Novosphingobium sp.]